MMMNFARKYLRHTPSALSAAFFCAVLLFLPGALASPQSDSSGSAAPAKPDPAAGKPVFERYCSPCHGISGDGGRGPRLNRSYLPHAPDDNELRSVIENGIPPGMPEASYLSKEEIANVAAHIRSLAKLPEEIVAGDAVRGANVYARSGCSDCHIHNGHGIGYGPELTTIGDRRSSSFLKGVVSNPASELPEGFLLVTAVTPSGAAISGIRVNEDTFTIQIKDRDGRLFSFRKSSLKQLRRDLGKTPMPSFANVLLPPDLRDLVAFLASSRQSQ